MKIVFALFIAIFVSTSSYAVEKKVTRKPNSEETNRFSEECDKMRDTLVTFSASLQALNKNSMGFVYELRKKGGQPDLAAYNAAIRDMADEIDRLTVKVNRACK